MFEHDFLLNEFLVQPSLHRVVINNKEITLEPKLMAMLLLLAKNNKTMLTRLQIVDAIWPSVAVSDNSINQSISQLRKIFDCDPNCSSIIETIPKKGYRLNALLRSPNGSDQTNQNKNKTRAFSKKIASMKPLGVLLAIIALLILFYDFSFTDNNTRFPIKFGKIKSITSLPGIEFDHHLNPTGQWLAFVHKSEQSSLGQIYISPIETQTIFPITDGKETVRLPKWSPSGHHIAFLLHSSEKCSIELAILKPVIHSLVKIKRIYDCTDQVISSISWSATDTSLFVSKKDKISKVFQVNRLNIASGKLSEFLPRPKEGLGDHFLKVSPSGKKLLLLRYTLRNNFQPIVVDLISKEETSYASMRGLRQNINWGENDHSLLTTIENDIYAFDLMSERYSQVYSAGTETIWNPIFSPANNSLFFTSYQSTSRIIEISNPRFNPLAVNLPFIDSSGNDTFPAAANNSDRLIFVSNRNGLPQLWLRDIDGTISVLTEFTEHIQLGRMVWSPNDQWILGEVDEKLYLGNLDDGVYRSVITDYEYNYQPSWSRDGQFIYYSAVIDDAYQIIKRSVQDNSENTLTNSGGYQAQESVDGQYLYYTKHQQNGLWKSLLDNNKLSLLADTEQLVISDFDGHFYKNWYVFTDGIYYWKQNQGIRFYDFKKSQSTLLHHQQNHTSPYYSITNGQRSFITSENTKLEANIMVLNQIQ